MKYRQLFRQPPFEREPDAPQGRILFAPVVDLTDPRNAQLSYFHDPDFHALVNGDTDDSTGNMDRWILPLEWHPEARIGDEYHPEAGTVSTPPLSIRKRAQAHHELDEHVMALHRAAEQELADELLRKRLGLSLSVGTPHADALAALDAKAARTAIDAAKTHHDLPDEVRGSVRGYPDGYGPGWGK
jgi:hypothetical protein